MDARPRLLDQVRNQPRTLHYSNRTEQQYLFWVRRFILFHGKRHPADMSTGEIELFLTHLAVDRKVSASTQNQALAALLFLYQRVLQVDLPWLDGVVRAKQSRYLPVVLTPGEVKDILSHLQGEYCLIGSLLYGAGLRLPEALVVPLQQHLVTVKARHESATRGGFAGVELPHALDRKYPNAHLEWGWQYVFPAKRPSRDPRSGAATTSAPCRSCWGTRTSGPRRSIPTSCAKARTPGRARWTARQPRHLGAAPCLGHALDER